jgi:hypothetical protein
MRRQLFLAAVLTVFAAGSMAAPVVAHAQGRGGQQDPDAKAQEDAAKKKKRDEDWGNAQGPLPQLRNAGPCPFVKTLYDASRYVEFKDKKEASANVGFTGEIQGISAACQYKVGEPIQLQMEALFELGKGPTAEGVNKVYRYWVAVTDRNRDVIAKKTFDLPVNFPAGKDRVYVTEQLKQIVIPRADEKTSGSNFEVLIGFEVTPEMAAFNRDGKRFRLNAGTAVAAATK